MNRKKIKIVGVVIFVIITVSAATVYMSTKWSKKSFEAVVQETVVQSSGERQLIVERTSEIYGNPLNSLHISDDTNLVNTDQEEIQLEDFRPGDSVEVTLKNSFIEETPFYYPTVYEVIMIDASK